MLRGSPKETRLVRGEKHMGEPESFTIILAWLYKLLGLEGQPGDQLRMVPSKAKY